MVQLEYALSDVSRYINHQFMLSRDELDNSVVAVRRLFFTIASDPTDASLFNYSLLAPSEAVLGSAGLAFGASLNIVMQRCGPGDMSRLIHICPFDTVKKAYVVDKTNPPQVQDAHRWHDALAAADAMQVLSIRCASHCGMFLQVAGALVCQGNHPVLCPSLETLDIALGTTGAPEFWDLLERVASTRKSHGVPLKTIMLDVSDVDEDDEEQMEAIQDHVGELLLVDRSEVEGHGFGPE